MADLPDISPDLDQPLPQVDPNSDLVPYRTSSTQPGQLPVVTTGWGPRARPIQPPSGGGVGVPDMSAFLGEAMQHLPVDEALRATAAASQYIAQRGYQRDIANGESAPKALMKWLPVMRNSTGLSEALQFQQAQLKAAQPTIRAVGGRLYRVPPTTGEAQAISPEPPAKVVPPKYFHDNGTGEITEVNPDGTTRIVKEGTPKPPRPAPLTGEEKDATFEWQEAVREQNKVISAEQGATKTSKQKLDNAQKRVDAARKKLDDIRNKAVSPQEFVPDTSQAAPAPAVVPQAGVKIPMQGNVPAGADLPNPARRKQPTQGAQGETPKVTTKTQFDDLPSGTVYIGKDGKRYRKP